MWYFRKPACFQQLSLFGVPTDTTVVQRGVQQLHRFFFKLSHTASHIWPVFGHAVVEAFSEEFGRVSPSRCRKPKYHSRCTLVLERDLGYAVFAF